MNSTPWQRYEVTAKLLEDAHLGSGAGNQSIDALIARNRKGQPVIWASQFEGILRDVAVSMFGYASDNVKRLFGTRGNQRQQAIFTSLHSNDAKESRIWRSTARVSYANRAPKDNTLRVVEFVPMGTSFRGEVEMPLDLEPVLRRLLREVDAVGHGRATGAGRVEWTLTALEPPNKIGLGAAKKRLLVLLRNVEPLCIAHTAIPDNIIPTLAFIPGRTVMGALTAWLLDNSGRYAAENLIAGKINVSDALPLPADFDVKTNLVDVHVLPAPLTLQAEKPKGVRGVIPSWAYKSSPKKRVDGDWARKHNVAAEKLKRPEPDLFLYRKENSAWETYCPEKRIRLRHGRVEANAAEKLNLFALEQIAENTCFVVEIHSELETVTALANALEDILSRRRWLRMGRSSTPVEVVAFAWANDTHEKTNATLQTNKTTKNVLLTLTSDLLVRGDDLRWKSSLVAADFASIPGWPPNVTVEPVMQEDTLVAGFNGTARLWRLPMTAIRRGSVFRLSGTGIHELAERLAKREWLGERTHEGHGRFRLDDELPGVTEPKKQEPVLMTGGGPDQDERICSRTKSWFEEIGGSLDHGKTPGPTLSQWYQYVEQLENDTEPRLSAKAGWDTPNTKKILEKLKAFTTKEERLIHARMFLRWLRAHQRDKEWRAFQDQLSTTEGAA